MVTMNEATDPHALEVKAARLKSKRKQLRTILCEALRCATLRGEIDGKRSGKIEWLIESLRLHIRNVDLGCSSPSPGRYRRWLRRLRRVPCDAPSRWAEAAKSVHVIAPAPNGTEGAS